MKIIGIARETLEFILSVSKSSAPMEFAGLMQQTDGVITDIMILPGTESSDRNAVIKLFMMPNIKSVGSIHSHPTSNVTPSKADLRLFGKQEAITSLLEHRMMKVVGNAMTATAKCRTFRCSMLNSMMWNYFESFTCAITRSPKTFYPVKST